MSSASDERTPYEIIEQEKEGYLEELATPDHANYGSRIFRLSRNYDRHWNLDNTLFRKSGDTELFQPAGWEYERL